MRCGKTLSLNERVEGWGPSPGQGRGICCAAGAGHGRRRSRPLPWPRGCGANAALVHLTQPLLRGSAVPIPRVGRDLPCVPSPLGSLPRSAGAMASAFQERGFGAPMAIPATRRARPWRLREPRAPTCMGGSWDLKTRGLKLSNLTFHKYFCLLSIFSYLPNQSPLHLWCAFRTAMNFKMCKNDRILTKALIFLFTFMHFIN